MLKVKPPDDYPPEEGRYIRGNDYSPVAVCVILDTFDFAIPSELNELVMAGVDSGAALSGMLQTENIGLEKMICNIVANPNIRYIVLCGRESAGHLPGESLLALKENGVSDTKQIVGTVTWTQPKSGRKGSVELLPGRASLIHGLYTL
jgi:tetrahydromethanopterin S-methyltransferase subunit A